MPISHGFQTLVQQPTNTLSNLKPYTGSDYVMVGNGENLSITYISQAQVKLIGGMLIHVY